MSRVREPKAIALWRVGPQPGGIGHYYSSHPHVKDPDPDCFDCATRAFRKGGTYCSGRGRISGGPDAVNALAEIVTRCPMRREYAERLAKVWW